MKPVLQLTAPDCGVTWGFSGPCTSQVVGKAWVLMMSNSNARFNRLRLAKWCLRLLLIAEPCRERVLMHVEKTSSTLEWQDLGWQSLCPEKWMAYWLCLCQMSYVVSPRGQSDSMERTEVLRPGVSVPAGPLPSAVRAGVNFPGFSCFLCRSITATHAWPHSSQITGDGPY